MLRAALVLLMLVLLIFSAGCLSEKEKTIETPVPTATEPPQTIAPKPPVDIVAETPAVNSFEENDIEYLSLLNEKYTACIKCHGDVKSFHAIKVVYLIDQRKGLNPRLCIVCHGRKVHDVHWAVLQNENIVCDTCHNIKGEFKKPEVEQGMLLVCEACHSRGNYIKIHIEGVILEDAIIDDKWIRKGANHQCDTCHIGDYDTIHFDVLKSWREEIDQLIFESTSSYITPLNISYA